MNAAVAPLTNPDPLIVTDVAPDVEPVGGTMLEIVGPVGVAAPLKMQAEGPDDAPVTAFVKYRESVSGWKTSPAAQPPSM